MVTLDTNVAVYAFSDVEAKSSAAFDVVLRSSFVSVQVLNEFANVLVGKRKLDWEQAARMVAELRAAFDHVVSIDEDIHDHGIRLARKYRLAFYDALIVAAALSGGATTLYSEDMHDGLVVDDRLRIVNPFKANE